MTDAQHTPIVERLRAAQTLPNGLYAESADTISDLLEACIWAEAALAPFSKEPAEKSGITKLRAAINKARARSEGR